jgi:FXSXX-COOH protein
MESEPGEVVTEVVDLSRVPLAEVPVLAKILRRLIKDAEQVSAFNSSI